MDLNSITVADFKEQFPRDFPYLPVYSDTKLYNLNAEVYYELTELFYKCLANGTLGELPTDTDFWELYADDIYNFILDADITRAFAEAQVVFNQGILPTDAIRELAYLYLTAHYLVIDIQNANQGLQSTGKFNVQSRSVGSVSENYAIPQKYLDDPNLAFYTKTGYGVKYLSLVMPNIVGNVVAVYGGTNP